MKEGDADVNEMKAVVDRHLKAEGAGDVEGAISVYTDDIVHDAVGFPARRATARTLPASSMAS